MMAKTNKERQAEFRDKMRLEGRQAMHVWATPAQVTQIQAILAGQSPAPLQVTKRSTSSKKALLVTERERRAVLPAIPARTPASIVRDLKESEKILRKKLVEIEKLEKDAAAIEKGYRQTVEECKRL
jgi:hypothetical protein